MEDFSKYSSPMAVENVVLRLLLANPSSVCAALMDGLLSWPIRPSNLYITLPSSLYMASVEFAFCTQVN